MKGETMTRVLSKTMTVGGRTFIQHKFDPLFGSFMAYKVFSSSKGGKEDLAKSLAALMGDSFEQYEKFIKSILKYCSESLPAGEVPVINSEGNIAIVDLTPDLIMELVLDNIFFNFEGFFEKSPEENPGHPSIAEAE